MTERRCENCRWFVGLGENDDGDDLCFRYPQENATGPNSFCGEWADAGITPEQEEQRELIRRFAVAIIGTEWGGDLEPIRVWPIARDLAMMESAAEPRIQYEPPACD